mmetsp:Transcript_4666/g.7586  ORF Transcript_4666/g.7586 Transcript_4666/m.7586 type:complete len:225 (+) Transcript_4666:72-746(+)
MERILLAYLVSIAAGLTLRNSTIANERLADVACQLKNTLPFTSFALSNDDILNTATPSGDDSNKKQKQLQMAIQNYRKEKEHFQSATAELMEAMEAFLEVPAADADTLRKLAEGKLGKDTFIVMYAPWCPHCQQFVLHDRNGNPSNAPLEVLRRDLLKEESTKNVVVMRADITKLGQTQVPPKFQVPSIPAMFFVNQKGEETKFTGQSHSLPVFKEFIRGHMEH